MEVTVLGWILIPGGILAWFAGIEYLLILAVISAVFQGAAVINISSSFDYSLSPYYFVCILISTRMLLTWKPVAWYLLRRDYSAKLFRGLLYFFLWAVISGLTLPFLFSGIGVYNPRIGVDVQYQALTPLAWNFGNLSQLLYLMLNLVMLFAAWRQSANLSTRRRISKAFYAMGAIVIVFAFYQKGSFLFGWPFPTDILYSNAQADMRDLSFEELGADRIFSTFSEPSLFSAFLASYILFLLNYRCHSLGSSWLKVAILVLSVMSLIWSKSTTGYLTLGLMLMGLFWLHAVNPLVIYGSIQKRQLIGFITAIVIMSAALVAFGTESLDEVVFQKADSLSWMNRQASNVYAMQLLFKTGGLGVGLGSNRPSSFLPFLFGTVGIPGVVIFSSVLWMQIRMLLRARAQSSEDPDMIAASWAWFGTLLGMLIAIPDLAWQMLWVTWMLLLVSVQSRSVGLPHINRQSNVVLMKSP